MKIMLDDIFGKGNLIKESLIKHIRENMIAFSCSQNLQIIISILITLMKK